VTLVDLYQCNWRELTTLVLSPGIPHLHPSPHPVAELAKRNGVEIVCDVELLGRSQRAASYIGVTGTNGKSTTTALIGHLLEAAGYTVEVGANLGRPALDLAPLGHGGVYVLEMSSYQLELTFSITFDVAVLLNVSPDHLDRHGGMDGYVAAKRRIFNRQTAPRTAVIGVDDRWCVDIHRALVEGADQVVVPISTTRRLPQGVFVVDGRLYDAMAADVIEAVDLRPIATLPGAHNWQNAAAAYAAARAINVDRAKIAAAMATYPGLPHRQELVAEIDGVRFVNDSKATNADAAAKALACYDAIYWIAGGRAKQGGIEPLVPLFPRLRRAYLIGEAAAEFARTLDGRADYLPCGDLATAVRAAFADARAAANPGAVVLLSPACASFDQFADFEARGAAFRELVTSLVAQRQPSVRGRAGGSA
jgi:UDP-N-acetylmuramoylalanine--D-glutamate ligase